MTEGSSLAITNLITAVTRLGDAFRNMSGIMLDMNKRIGVLEGKVNPEPKFYRPPRDAVVSMMEATGKPWDKCEEQLIKEYYARLQ